MYNTIKEFHKQFADSWKIIEGLDVSNLKDKTIHSIHLAGMGGSALPADIVNDYLKGKISITVTRDYELPGDAGVNDLVICSSFSGNTEETISALEDAQKRKCPVVVMSHGGKLKQMAEEQSLPFIQIPDCIQPRCATGYFFTSLVGLLSKLGYIPNQEDLIMSMGDFLGSRQEWAEEKGKELAANFHEKVPVIYGPTEFYAVCRIWKIKMNENAKIQSFFNVFPELNHNEMCGYTKMIMNPALLYIKSKFMHKRNIRRMEVMADLFKDKMPIFELELTGKDKVHEMFEALLVGDYTTYYLAEKYGIDPAPVEMVESFKKMLG